MLHILHALVMTADPSLKPPPDEPAISDQWELLKTYPADPFLDGTTRDLTIWRRQQLKGTEYGYSYTNLGSSPMYYFVCDGNVHAAIAWSMEMSVWNGKTEDCFEEMFQQFSKLRRDSSCRCTFKDIIAVATLAKGHNHSHDAVPLISDIQDNGPRHYTREPTQQCHHTKGRMSIKTFCYIGIIVKNLWEHAEVCRCRCFFLNDQKWHHLEKDTDDENQTNSCVTETYKTCSNNQSGRQKHRFARSCGFF
ncbi:hypothetical protein BDZ85DRAFT_91760 [Elsinoe ampelina]|uniref:Uncharacterized protein n=1 Tax=Elsinoe ampelina TaxID=302913 RepID=A0A6A6GIP3_9PEZI|nr:hypothetical protein BDZ85DRAFT_91760 [Elsinoe ampelina]